MAVCVPCTPWFVRLFIYLFRSFVSLFRSSELRNFSLVSRANFAPFSVRPHPQSNCCATDSSAFQLSPDFRQRASSNASSVGRLSPIPSVLGIEPDWFDPREDFLDDTKAITASTTSLDNVNLENLEAVAAGEDTLDAANLSALDALAGALADDLTLRTEFLQGSVSYKSGQPTSQPVNLLLATKHEPRSVADWMVVAGVCVVVVVVLFKNICFKGAPCRGLLALQICFSLTLRTC